MNHKRNFLKIIRVIAGALAFIGIVLVIGAAGHSDYGDEIGEPTSTSDFVPQMVTGLVMTIPSLFAFRNYGIEESEDEYATESEQSDLW